MAKVSTPHTAAPTPTSSGFEADSFVPELGGGLAKQAEPMLADRMDPFVLTCHPSAWHFLGGLIVPRLATQVQRPGVNGLGVDRNGGIVVNAWKTHLEGREAKIIPPHFAPNGVSYVKRIKLSYGFIYLTVFEEPVAGSSSTRQDAKAYARWCQSLVDRGFIAPISQVAVERGLKLAQSRLAAALQLDAKGKGDPAVIDSAKAEVEAWKAAKKATPEFVYEVEDEFFSPEGA